MKRSEGPKRPACLTVVRSPLWGLRAGAGGYAEQETREQGCVGEDGVLDVQREGASLPPCGEVEGGMGVAQAAQHDGGEEVVPCGVGGGEPAGGRVGDELPSMLSRSPR